MPTAHKKTIPRPEYCYTQLTDVEQEQNGIYAYDRSSKFDMRRIAAILGRNPPALRRDGRRA
jgi:hypothetical protein